MVNDILLIDGVGSANVIGALDYAMRIWLNPNKLATLKLTTTDVISAIEKQKYSSSCRSNWRSTNKR